MLPVCYQAAIFLGLFQQYFYHPRQCKLFMELYVTLFFLFEPRTTFESVNLHVELSLPLPIN